MDFLLIGHDGPDPAAREAAREPHLASLRRACAAGQLMLSGPRLGPDGAPIGSLQVFTVPDRAALDATLAAEPFTAGVWARVEILPFRIAPVAWPARPGTPGGPAGPVLATAVLAMDGPGGLPHRLAVRPRHFARLEGEIAAGRVLFGGAILDAPEGAMVGSLMVLAMPEAAAREWLAEEPYVAEGVWGDTRLEAWRIGAQPYPPLPYAPPPGAAA
jgi:uncharacterized protein YciI